MIRCLNDLVGYSINPKNEEVFNLWYRYTKDIAEQQGLSMEYLKIPRHNICVLKNPSTGKMELCWGEFFFGIKELEKRDFYLYHINKSPVGATHYIIDTDGVSMDYFKEDNGKIYYYHNDWGWVVASPKIEKMYIPANKLPCVKQYELVKEEIFKLEEEFKNKKLYYFNKESGYCVIRTLVFLASQLCVDNVYRVVEKHVEQKDQESTKVFDTPHVKEGEKDTGQSIKELANAINDLSKEIKKHKWFK